MLSKSIPLAAGQLAPRQSTTDKNASERGLVLLVGNDRFDVDVSVEPESKVVMYLKDKASSYCHATNKPLSEHKAFKPKLELQEFNIHGQDGFLCGLQEMHDFLCKLQEMDDFFCKLFEEDIKDWKRVGQFMFAPFNHPKVIESPYDNFCGRPMCKIEDITDPNYSDMIMRFLNTYMNWSDGQSINPIVTKLIDSFKITGNYNAMYKLARQYNVPT